MSHSQVPAGGARSRGSGHSWARNTGRRGGILLIVVIVMGLLFTLLAVVGTDTVFNLQSSAEIGERKQARYAAYAGIQRALHELAKNEDWSRGFEDEPLPLRPEAKYSIHVENQMSADPAADPVVYKGVEVPPGTVYIEATGWARGAEMRRIVAGMSGLALKAKPSFINAVFANSGVSLSNGSKTDSWSSAASLTYADAVAYDTRDAKPEDLEKYGLRKGSVGCNEHISLNNSSVVKGKVQVKPPPGGDNPDYLHVDATSSHGTRESVDKGAGVPSFQAPFDPASAVDSITYADLEEPAPVPQGQTPGPKWLRQDRAYKDLKVEVGETVELRPGTYYFSEFVDIQGTVVKGAGGPVIIYIGQEMVLNGSLNPGGAAKDVQVYFTDEKEITEPKEDMISELHMDSGSGSFLAVGNKLDATIKDGAVYGAVVGNSVDLNASQVHFDTTLETLNAGGIPKWTLEGLHESSGS